MTFKPTIGLEIHVQLNTDQKLFSSSLARFSDVANKHINETDLALPGALPVVNKSAVEKAIILATAIGAEVPETTLWDRKHYFYPDSSFGYQITQNTRPIIGPAKIYVTPTLCVRIHHAHLEADAGKNVHGSQSGVDYNRAGCPLIEIVSEPDMHSAKEAMDYVRYIHGLVKYLNICDGKLQEGSFRMDINVSVSETDELGTRCELKNINSFDHGFNAIEYEIERQIELLESGKTVTQQTRLYDEVKGITHAMRDKEDAVDYRYFPDPDLPIVEIPRETVQKFRQQYKMPYPVFRTIIQTLEIGKNEKELILHDQPLLLVVRNLAEHMAMTTENVKVCLFNLIDKIHENKISNNDLLDWCGYTLMAKKQLSSKQIDECVSRSQTIDEFKELITSEIQNIPQIDPGVEQMIEAFKTDPKYASEYGEFKSGNKKAFGFFMGQLKQSFKNVDPKQLSMILNEKLK